MSFSRRHFLRDGALTLSAASLPGFSVAAAAKASIAVTDVNGLALITGAGANAVALAGPEGALLVDGGLSVHSAALLKAVATATNTKRVATLINTHWHPEQTGLNEQAGKSGARIIAHENTKLWLKRRITTDWLPAKGYGPLPPAAT